MSSIRKTAKHAAAANLAAEEEVGGDVQRGRDGEVLVDGLDAGAARVEGRAGSAPLAVQQDLALVWLVAPDSALISDDLPAPLSPITASTSPGRVEVGAGERGDVPTASRDRAP